MSEEKECDAVVLDRPTGNTHRVTFVLEDGHSVSMDTRDPELCKEHIQEGIDGYYRSWWRGKSKTSFALHGHAYVVVMIPKILFYKIEPLVQ